jgi:hypothetical protein
LKVDTYNLDLFSSRTYSETSQHQVTREFKFLDLVDQKTNQNRDRIKQSQISSQAASEVVAELAD